MNNQNRTEQTQGQNRSEQNKGQNRTQNQNQDCKDR